MQYRKIRFSKKLYTKKLGVGKVETFARVIAYICSMKTILFLVIFLISFSFLSAQEVKSPLKPPIDVEKEVKPEAPGEDFIWIKGHWKWMGNKYAWINGYYVENKEGQTWIDGSWQRTGNSVSWIFNDGYWKKDAAGIKSLSNSTFIKDSQNTTIDQPEKKAIKINPAGNGN